MRRLVLILLLLVCGKSFATGEINVLTDLKSPFPPGCVAVSLPTAPSQGADSYIVDVPSVGSSVRDAEVAIDIWRIGCHDPGFSVVLVRIEPLSTSRRVLVPQVFAEPGIVDVPFHVAQLTPHPAIGHAGATGNTIPEEGRTYLLAVEPFDVDGNIFSVDEYNDLFTLEFYWGDFVSDANSDPASMFALVDVPPYQPDETKPNYHPPQHEHQILHGRMTSAWIIDGIPRSGMTLNIGEQADNTNYAFVLFFTYLDGEPAWITGNTDAGLEPGFDLIEMTMYLPSGGQFFGLGQDLFQEEDVDMMPIGDMVVEALDCNTLLIGFDFSSAGLGSNVYEARRMVRNAGFDCNPWD